MIYASAESLSTALNADEIKEGALYPDIERIREVSVAVTAGVIRAAQRGSVDRELPLRNLSDGDLDKYIRERMYDPKKERQLLQDELAELIKSVQPSSSL